MLQSTNKVKVDLSYGQLQPIIDWCDRNCKGVWHYTEDPNGNMYSGWIFVFEDERDYVAFTLWKK